MATACKEGHLLITRNKVYTNKLICNLSNKFCLHFQLFKGKTGIHRKSNLNSLFACITSQCLQLKNEKWLPLIVFFPDSLFIVFVFNKFQIVLEIHFLTYCINWKIAATSLLYNFTWTHWHFVENFKFVLCKYLTNRVQNKYKCFL